MKRSLFITGTDTDIGKTFVCSLIMSVLRDKENAKYYKPIQTGLDLDTETVVQRSGIEQSQVIPSTYCLKEPMSPDRAAILEKREISLDNIIRDVSRYEKDFIVIEGAGGIEVPLNSNDKTSHLIQKLRVPLIIVASTRLGTINHTLLTVERAKSLGIEVKGVVLVGPEDEGLEDIFKREGVNVLFRIPWLKNIEKEWGQLVEENRNEIKNLFKIDDTRDSSISSKDRNYVWHPFTQHKLFESFPVVTSGAGSELYLENGKVLLDGISSWWVNLHGHANPKMVEAIARQASRLEHVIFAGYTHEPAVELSQKIVSKFQERSVNMEKCFFSDNGSTAVEVALKMAYQYQQQKGNLKKTKFLALHGSYHGDTLGAMAVGEREGFHKVFQPLFMDVDFIEPDDFSALDNLTENYAACIVEPLVQGAGGMKMYSKKYLKALFDFCQKKNILFICDEIFTGFYRTGKFFSFEYAEIQPDLVCLSKGLTGGYLPMALTVASEEVFSAFLSDGLDKAFLHGHSYTANPLACAAALMSLELLEESSCQERISSLAGLTKSSLASLRDIENISNIRSLGTIGAFDVGRGGDYFSSSFSKVFSKLCQEKGALIRPLGKTVYTVPPYSMSDKQFEDLYRIIRSSVDELQKV